MKTQKKLHKKSGSSMNLFLSGKFKNYLSNSIKGPVRTIPQRLLMALKKTQHA